MPSTEINGVPIISFIKSAGACISKCGGGGGTIASSAERLSSRSCHIAAGRVRYLAKDPFSDYKSTSLSSALKFLIRTARVRKYNIYIYLVSIAENPILLFPARLVRFVIFSTTSLNRNSWVRPQKERKSYDIDPALDDNNIILPDRMLFYTL